MLNKEYIEELSVLIGLGFVFVLLLSKILSCCYFLGLYQKHKEIKLRKDFLIRAKIDCLQAERVGEDKSALKDIVCTCGNPRLPFLPKSESCSPSSNIP